MYIKLHILNLKSSVVCVLTWEGTERDKLHRYLDNLSCSDVFQSKLPSWASIDSVLFRFCFGLIVESSANSTS